MERVVVRVRRSQAKRLTCECRAFGLAWSAIMLWCPQIAPHKLHHFKEAYLLACLLACNCLWINCNSLGSVAAGKRNQIMAFMLAAKRSASLSIHRASYWGLNECRAVSTIQFIGTRCNLTPLPATTSSTCSPFQYPIDNLESFCTSTVSCFGGVAIHTCRPFGALLISCDDNDDGG